MTAEIVTFRPTSLPPDADLTGPRPLVDRTADALHILGMAQEQLKAAKGIDHRRRGVRQISTLLWVVEDILRRGIADTLGPPGA